jgi:hypothetical protein
LVTQRRMNTSCRLTLKTFLLRRETSPWISLLLLLTINNV